MTQMARIAWTAALMRVLEKDQRQHRALYALFASAFAALALIDLVILVPAFAVLGVVAVWVYLAVCVFDVLWPTEKAPARNHEQGHVKDEGASNERDGTKLIAYIVHATSKPPVELSQRIHIKLASAQREVEHIKEFKELKLQGLSWQKVVKCCETAR